jgi:hypothetical protein
MKSAILIAMLFASSAFALQDNCRGDGFTVKLDDHQAVVTGNGLIAVTVPRLTKSSDPDDHDAWPEYSNRDGSIDLMYFNGLDPSAISQSNFTAHLEVIGMAGADLICDSPTELISGH